MESLYMSQPSEITRHLFRFSSEEENFDAALNETNLSSDSLRLLCSPKNDASAQERFQCSATQPYNFSFMPYWMSQTSKNQPFDVAGNLDSTQATDLSALQNFNGVVNSDSQGIPLRFQISPQAGDHGEENSIGNLLISQSSMNGKITSFSEEKEERLHCVSYDVQEANVDIGSEKFSLNADSPMNCRTTVSRPSDMTRRAQYRKTKPCPWFSRGKCWLSEQCNYAHHETELQVRPDLTCTKLCPKGTRCKSPQCRFAHKVEELRATGIFFRTKLCKYWSRGIACPLGPHCRHAHGTQQLRVTTPKASDTQNGVSPYNSFIEPGGSVAVYASPPMPREPTKQAVGVLPFRRCANRQTEIQTDETTTVSDPLQHLQWKYENTLPVASPSSQPKNERGLLSEFSSSLSSTSPFRYGTPNSFATHVSKFPHASDTLSFPRPTAKPFSLAGTPYLALKDEQKTCYGEDIIQLNEILHLAVSSRDPELLESSARVLRASLTLKSQSLYSVQNSNHCSA